MNCSPPGSPVHGLLQARILEWVAIFFSRAFYLDLPFNKEDIPWMLLRDQANIPGKFLPSSRLEPWPPSFSPITNPQVPNWLPLSFTSLSTKTKVLECMM